MNLADVMIETAKVLQDALGFTVASWPVAKLVAPAGYVSYPREIDYDQTYQRGSDQFTDLPIVLVCGKANDEAARNTAAAWTDGSGATSVKQLLEQHAWTSCDDLTVTTAEFDVEMLGGVPYLAAMFKATVVGPGKE